MAKAHLLKYHSVNLCKTGVVLIILSVPFYLFDVALHKQINSIMIRIIIHTYLQ